MVKRQDRLAEVYVPEILDVYSDEYWVYATIEGIEERLVMSIMAVKHLLKYACETGILLPQDSIVQYRVGGSRRIYDAKDTEIAT